METAPAPSNNDSIREVHLGIGAEALLADPTVLSVSLRRHGAYERDADSVQRGQLTRATMPATKDAAKEWVTKLPGDADIKLITSPTGMPATGPNGALINPARARMTGALYGVALRGRFGNEYGFLAPSETSEKNRSFVRPNDELQAPRTTERRLGDIFEYTDNSKGQFVQPFFKELSSAYGGLTPDFWRDYMHGSLPTVLNAKFIEGGGQTALEKAIAATDVLSGLVESQVPDKKNVALLVSHEEVIGSFAYQIGEYLKATGSASEEDIEAIETVKFGYNDGFDLHIGRDGATILELKGRQVSFDIQDLKQYLDHKQKDVT